MGEVFERYYGKTFRGALAIVNPFKKMIMKTECKVHRFINYQAIKIIKKYKYDEEFVFLNYYLEDINKGVVWADQDFKSIGHFYSSSKKRGLYGHNNASDLAFKYYNKAIEYWEKGNMEKSMFFLGASVHLLQDLTIPQHANIRLLDNHKQFEDFVRLTYDIVKDFTSYEKPIIFKKLNHYVEFNAKIALKTYKRFKRIRVEKDRFYKIALCVLPLAQRTTAGCFLTFLNDVKFEKRKALDRIKRKQ